MTTDLLSDLKSIADTLDNEDLDTDDLIRIAVRLSGLPTYPEPSWPECAAALRARLGLSAEEPTHD